MEVCDIHPSLSIKLRVISHNDTSYFGNYHSYQSYPLIKILNEYSALRVLRFINSSLQVDEKLFIVNKHTGCGHCLITF